MTRFLRSVNRWIHPVSFLFILLGLAACGINIACIRSVAFADAYEKKESAGATARDRAVDADGGAQNSLNDDFHRFILLSVPSRYRPDVRYRAKA